MSSGSSGMLDSFSDLRNRFASKEDLDDDDFEEMANTISGILSGKYEEDKPVTADGAKSLPETAATAGGASVVKPPRKDKAKWRKEVSSG